MDIEYIKQELQYGELNFLTDAGATGEFHLGDTDFDMENGIIHFVDSDNNDQYVPAEHVEDINKHPSEINYPE